MHPIAIIALLLLCFWSLFTTFKAIYLIFTKDFRGGKIKWVMISMIGILGPILWILFGKQYLHTENE